MKTYIVTITEVPSEDCGGGQFEYYRRRIELEDVQAAISALDQVLNKPVRRKRSDAGKSREKMSVK